MCVGGGGATKRWAGAQLKVLAMIKARHTSCFFVIHGFGHRSTHEGVGVGGRGVSILVVVVVGGGGGA